MLISCMSLGYIFGTSIKIIVQRARPEQGLVSASGFSFPSGHATMAVIFFSLLIYLFRDEIKNKALRWIFVAGCWLLIFLVGISRVYLGVHWLSDVLAGWALGLFVVSLGIVVFRKKNKS